MSENGIDRRGRVRFRRDTVRSARRQGQRADQGGVGPGELPCPIDRVAGGER